MWIFNIVPANAARDLFQGVLVQLDIRQFCQVRLSLVLRELNSLALRQRHQFLCGFALQGFFNHFLCDFVSVDRHSKIPPKKIIASIILRCVRFGLLFVFNAHVALKFH